MSAKRPRPAIPVLVHVDNPAEAASVTVDTSTIEGKMDTVITNQNRIYDKIPTSSGGGGSSADLTTVNEKTTALAETIGPADSNLASNNLFGAVKNLSASVGDFNSTPSDTGTSVRSFLYSLRLAIGPTNSTASDSNLLGSVKNLVGSIGNSTGGIFLKDKTIRSLLYNLREGIGNAENSPTATETTVRGLLTAIKENTASGGGGGSADLTTVNEKATAVAAAIGSASDDASTVSVIGLLKSITDKY